MFRANNLGYPSLVLFCRTLVYALLLLTNAGAINTQNQASVHKIPVIDVTDLYHPYQDPGDNFDLITAYALPEIDLRAVILDATEAFLKPVADDPVMWHDPNGPREPGVIPVLQLNYIFDRSVPYAIGPFTRMRSLTDTMRDVPVFQQQGIELLLKTMVESAESVDIVSFGSLRTIAAAYNRNPQLFRSKLRRLYVSAGSSTRDYEYGGSADHNKLPGGEWNVALDPLAFIRIMRSGLPIDWFPCATKDGAFEYGTNNSYWKLENLAFIADLYPQLKNYLDFAFARSSRVDFLRAVSEGVASDLAATRYREPHHVWETAVWLDVAGLAAVKNRDGHYRIGLVSQVRQGEQLVSNEEVPVRITVRDDARIQFKKDNTSPTRIYFRADPHENEKALQDALPTLYKSFSPSRSDRNDD